MTDKLPRWQTLALAASLLLNVAVIAGFLLQRSYAESRLAEPLSQALQLDSKQRTALLDMQAKLRQQAGQARRRGIEHSRSMADLLRMDRPERKEIQALLVAANQERLSVQTTAIEAIIGFRSGLGDAQRRRFDAALDQPRFLPTLTGVAASQTQTCPPNASEQ
jgi:uncharacterized membrane protein